MERVDFDAAFEKFMAEPTTRRVMMIYRAMGTPTYEDVIVLMQVAFAAGTASGAYDVLHHIQTKLSNGGYQ